MADVSFMAAMFVCVLCMLSPSSFYFIHVFIPGNKLLYKVTIIILLTLAQD